MGNLHFKCTEEEVLEFFEECGPIQYVRIVRDPKTYIGKGFCYVAFKESVGAQNALRMNGQEFKGREIRIKKAVQDPQNQSKKDFKKPGFRPQNNSKFFKDNSREEKSKKPRKEGSRSHLRALKYKEMLEKNAGWAESKQKRQNSFSEKQEIGQKRPLKSSEPTNKRNASENQITSRLPSKTPAKKIHK